MTIRKYDVEVRITIRLEIDDSVTSEFYPGETLMTVQDNPERFRPGTTHDQAMGALAISRGLWHSWDGWADFPRDAVPYASVSGDVEVEDVTEVTDG